MTLRVVDWAAIFWDFRDLHMTDEAIVRALDGNISKSMIHLYLSGASQQPLHSRGELILNYWCKVTGKDREDVPTRDPRRLVDSTAKRSAPSEAMSAYDALDAVFRPNLNINEVFARVTARQNASKRPNGDCNTLTLPGFE